MPRLLVLNNAILFLCCSIYLGIGVTVVFFNLPLEPKITVDNYYLIFVEPVQHASTFLTWMTYVMLITGFIMLVTEWFSGIRWVPVIVLTALIISTLVTVYLIFPHNRELNAGITDPVKLAETFHIWANLNRLRAALWTVQWLAMMYYFYRLALRARADR